MVAARRRVRCGAARAAREADWALRAPVLANARTHRARVATWAAGYVAQAQATCESCLTIFLVSFVSAGSVASDGTHLCSRTAVDAINLRRVWMRSANRTGSKPRPSCPQNRALGRTETPNGRRDSAHFRDVCTFWTPTSNDPARKHSEIKRGGPGARACLARRPSAEQSDS